jgi:small-conductance mechanosensitive channel
MQDFLNQTVESLRAYWLAFAVLAPRALAAILLLIGGFMLARILRRITLKILKKLRLDIVAEKAGIEDFLLRGGVRYTAVSIFANLVYWLILLAVTLAVLNSLGWQAATSLFERVILYIPNVIIALIVLLVGALIGRVVRQSSFTYLSNIGIEGAAFLSDLAQIAIMVFVASVALEQLAIGGQVLVSAFQIAFGALCLALALAFGLGGRDWAAHVLEKIWKK